MSAPIVPTPPASAGSLKLYPAAIECRDGSGEIVSRVTAFDVSAELAMGQTVFDAPSWAECSARIADAIELICTAN